MDLVLEWLQQATASPSELQRKLLASVIIFLIFWGIRFIVLRILNRSIGDVKVLYRWRKTVTYMAFLFAFLAIGRIWFQGFQTLSTFLGLLSAGLAIALQDPIVNLAGWLFLIWRRPFDVGDRIQIGDLRGDVIDIRIFQFTLMEIGSWVDAEQSTGRIIHVPNGKIFREAQANYTKGFEFIWNEIPVVVTFESDWRKAKGILHEIGGRHGEKLSKTAEEQVRKAARKYMIFFTHLTPIVYTRVVDIGVELTIRYLCEPRRRRSSSQEIWEEILDAFGGCDDVDFAYPTSRLYNNTIEGKSGARAALPQALQKR